MRSLNKSKKDAIIKDILSDYSEEKKVELKAILELCTTEEEMNCKVTIYEEKEKYTKLLPIHP